MKRTRDVYKSVLSATTILLALIFLVLTYAHLVRGTYQKEIMSSLKEVSGQNQTILENEIHRKQELIAEISRRISLYPSGNYQKTVMTLKQNCEDNNFKRMGIIMENGLAYTTDNQIMDLSDRDFFIRSMEGEWCVTEPLVDKADDEKINVYSTPIYKKKEIIGVLFATYAVSSMQKQLTVNSFGGEGFTYLVDKDGDYIVRSINEHSFPEIDNIFTSLRAMNEENEEAEKELEQGLAEGKTGCIKLCYDGHQYVYYMPLSVNNWYLLTIAPVSVLDQKMNSMLNMTYLFGLFLVMIFANIFRYVLKIQIRQERTRLDMLFVDPVTKGYSYAKFLSVTEPMLKRADANRYSVLNIDIDDFKFINELFGYEEGDRLICFMQKELGQWCQAGEIYAHQAADGFAAIIVDTDKVVTCRRLDALCKRIRNYFQETQDKLQAIPSIGVFHVMDSGQTMEYCLDCASIARKTIKGKYDVYYALYDEKIKRQLYWEKSIEAEMKTALTNEEFVVYYQPQYETVTKKLIGGEALVRWKRADGTLMMPGGFIPLFEKNGFITKLDEYVFRMVCRQQKEWLQSGYAPVPVSVNLSRMQLYDLKFIDRYVEILKEFELPVGYAEVEITESVFFDNQPRIIEVITSLKKEGFVILLDDFGTGYSSMSMLKNMAFDILKVDKSFVDSIGDPKGDKIVDGILRLADSLELKTIAEGVETMEQYEYLRNHGCDAIQGFCFGRPMEKEDFQLLLQKNI